MEQSTDVRHAVLRFYDRFSAGDTAGFADVIAKVPGVSVIGSAPDEGHDDRDEWISVYDAQIKETGIKLRGNDPRCYEDGNVGWGVDTPSFVLPDGSTLPTRLTAVLSRQHGDWKIAHLHFSVGVPDEEAIQPPQ